MAKKRPKIEKLVIPTDWQIGSDVPTHYATNLVVQFTPHECTISFFQAKPPFLLGSQEENLAALKSLTSIRADCVTRVVVALSRVPEFLEALKTSYERHLTSVSQIAAAKPTNGEKKK